jgi:hypothetical protein
MQEEEELMTAILGAQATQVPSTPACDATQIERGPQSQIQIQVGSRPSRHGLNFFLNNAAARGIVGRLGEADDDDMPGSGESSVPDLQAERKVRTVNVNHMDNNAAASESPPKKKKKRKYMSKNTVHGRQGNATYHTSGP